MSWFEEILARNRKQRDRWRDVPGSSVAILMGVAFCLFASVGMLTQLNTPLGTHWLAIVTPFLSGAFAAAILWISLRRNLWWVFGAVLAFLVVFFTLAFYLRMHPLGR